MSISVAAADRAETAEADLAVSHLGPLAWVMEEVRRSFEGTAAALHRTSRGLPASAAGPPGTGDTWTLPAASHQLHQVAGALEMVGWPAPARVVRAMESVLQVFIQQPPRCTEAGVRQVESAGFAVTEFLDTVLRGTPVSAVALFPQYSSVLALQGAVQAHPADLWLPRWAWQPVAVQATGVRLQVHSPALRDRIDPAILRVVQSGDPVAATELSALCAGLACGDPVPEAASFWALAAGFFEALGLSLLPVDLHVKRTASRVLLQYAGRARGDHSVSERLGQELAFFCALAAVTDLRSAPRLGAVRQAWALDRDPPARYDLAQFGRYDPALLAQVRKRVTAVREGWAALSGGDASRLRSTSEQFAQLHDGLIRLHPPFRPLAEALAALGHDIGLHSTPPRPELAMEGATAILFLEAVCLQFEPADLHLAPRTQRLAERLERVRRGESPEPLESWVEEIYRRVSDRQTMGSVVDELRSGLAELEKDLDTFFRQPEDRSRLQGVAGRLAQMRGVLAVLGLDHAAKAVVCMREVVQSIVVAGPHPTRIGVESLGNNLGALGFLVDMLNYQPALARKLFSFDATVGELRPIMGRMSAQLAAPEILSDDVGHAAPDSLPQATAGAVIEVDGALLSEKVFEAEDVFDTEVGSDGAEDEDEADPDPAQAVSPVPALSLPLAEEEPVKLIGPLRISLALFNVYLNEADEWSRALQAEMSEWAVDACQRLPDSLADLAHALGGSSATVGFQALANLARQLESSLHKTRVQGWAGDLHTQAYPAAVEEIRRLLHQFAVGFLAQADPGVIQALRAADEARVPSVGTVAPAIEPMPELQALREWPPLQELKELQDLQKARQPQPSLGASLVQRLPPACPAVESVSPGTADAARARVDPELFIFFEEEAQELLPQLAGALRQWHARPENQGARDEVLRVLHTFKGSARLAGALDLGERAHQMESSVQALAPQADSNQIEPLVRALDALQSAFDDLRAHPGGAACSQVAPAPDPPPGPGPGPEREPAPCLEPEPERKTQPVAQAQAEVKAEAEAEVVAKAEAEVRLALTPPRPALPAPQRSAGHLVRVRSQLLDRLVSEAGEVMISRSRLEAQMRLLRESLHLLTDNLGRLRSQLRDLELQSESQMQSRLAKEATADFDPLEFDRFTRVQELTRMMAESVDDVATVQRTLQRAVDSSEDQLLAQARQTRDLQRDLLKTRMLEFDALAERLHRVARQAASESGKLVRLEVEGGAIEIDRGVLDRMTPAFEHLLRNAVVHGIESPEDRARAGKPPEGRIAIALAQEGNDVSMTFSDDGAGLDLARIRAKALQIGLLMPDQALDESQVADLIFKTGLSTAVSVSSLAGRGIGMDVVRAEVDALGGRIEIDSRPLRGTRFRLVLPLTTAVTQVVMLRAGTRVFGVPVGLVELVQRTAAPVIAQAHASAVFEHAGERLPFHNAVDLLQCPAGAEDMPARTIAVVILRSAARRLALRVDEVLGQEEVVIKHLGPQLALLPGLAGMTVLSSGEVVQIYNPVALAAVHGAPARGLPAAGGVPGAVSVGISAADRAGAAVAQGLLAPPLVLVVDDSITVRRVTQRLLQREGYRVALAGDGLQALEQLALETPTLVLSDIEMPRMDGFDLARNLRADPRWSDLPIVMITSRLAAKHREHAASLGVNHYLGKPYPEEELLVLVGRYARRAVGAPRAPVTPPLS